MSPKLVANTPEEYPHDAGLYKPSERIFSALAPSDTSKLVELAHASGNHRDLTKPLSSAALFHAMFRGGNEISDRLAVAQDMMPAHTMPEIVPLHEAQSGVSVDSEQKRTA